MKARLTPQEEAQLVRDAQADPEAFAALYRYYFPRLYAYILYRMGRVQDAEDVVAETFTRVVENLATFRLRHDGAFTAWIYRIAQHVMADHFRDPRHLETSLDAARETVDGAPLPAEVLAQAEEFQNLRRFLSRLPARRREVVTLKFYGGLRNKDIAQVLGLSEKTVASTLCRALRELHTIYLEEHLSLPNFRLGQEEREHEQTQTLAS